MVLRLYPNFLNRFSKIDSNFVYFQFPYYEGWVYSQWRHKLLFHLLGLLIFLRTVCCYYTATSFCSSFYSTWGKAKEVDISLFNQACTKYSAKCIQQFPYDPHTWRIAQDFGKAPSLHWNSLKTLQKKEKILIGSAIVIFPLQKKFLLLETGSLFSHSRSSPQMYIQSH